MGNGAFAYRPVARWLSEGRVVPFLGAGASRSGLDDATAPPDAKRLSGSLLDYANGISGVSDSDPLPRVAQLVEHKLDRPALVEAVRDSLCDSTNAVSDVAQFLARIPRLRGATHVILTTNFDAQIEEAFSQREQPLCTITHVLTDRAEGPNTIEIVRPDGTSRRAHANDLVLSPQNLEVPQDTVFLYKMHGDACRLSADQDNLILTEEDYVRFLGAMGGTDSTVLPPPAINAHLKRCRFLFLGYGLADWNFRVILGALQQRRTLSSESAKKHFALRHSVSPIEKELWGKKNVQIVDTLLSDFIDAIEPHVPTQQQLDSSSS